MSKPDNIFDLALSVADHGINKGLGLAVDAAEWGVAGVGSGLAGIGAGASAVTATVFAAAGDAVSGQETAIEPLGIEIDAPEQELQAEVNPFAELLAGVNIDGMERLEAEYQAPTGLAELDNMSQNVAMSAEKALEQREAAFGIA